MRIVLSLCIALFAFFSVSVADARPRYKGYYKYGAGYHHQIPRRQMRNYAAIECNQQGCGDAVSLRPGVQERKSRKFAARSKYVAPRPVLATIGSSDLSSRARQYVGTNPTGWSSLWCGRFMAMIAPEAAARISNPNAARSWAELPATSAHVGAIAVMARGRCRRDFCPGHVGVVSGFQNGNPVIISGNNAGRVREAPYPAGRVLKYVSI